MDEMNIESLLLRDAASTAYPATPSMHAGVMSTIASPSPSTTPRSARPFARALVAFAITAFALLGALVVPASRDAIADFFGIEGSQVERLPTPAPGVTPTALPPARVVDDLATPVALDAIAATVGFEPALADGRTPQRAYVAHYGTAVAAILDYDDLDVWEVRSDGMFEGLFEKGVPNQTQILDVSVGGRPARWITGGPHLVGFYDAQRVLVEGSVRTVARSTLIWRTDGALYRIETSLTLADATRIAESLP